MRTVITATASILPPRVVTNDDLVARMLPSPEAATSDVLLASDVQARAAQIERKTGLRTRHYFHASEAPVEVGVELLQRLVTEGGDWGALDAVIVTSASINGFPGAAQQVVAATRSTAPDLGDPFALDINSAACASFVYALTVADALIRAAKYRQIAILAIEFASRCTGSSAPNTRAIFGDAATGVLLTADSTGIASLLTARAASLCTPETISLMRGGGIDPALPHSTVPDERNWYVAGPPVAIGATQLLVDEIARYQQFGAHIDWLIPHGANLARILLPACKRAGIASDRLVTTFGETANTSSASIPLALDRLVCSGKPKPGDNVLLVGFGASYAYGSALLEFAA